MPPKKSQPVGKQLSALFFKEDPDEKDTWECKECGVKRKVCVKRCGYSNLVSHINSAHSDDIEKRVLLSSNNNPFGSVLWPRKTKQIHAWMEVVIKGLQPFSLVASKWVRKHFAHESICNNTLVKYMEKLVPRIERKLSKKIPDRFALVIDGWDSGEGHYVAIFATWPVDNKEGYDTAILAFSPLSNEEKADADEHIDFINFTLDVFSKTISNVVAIVGDNCAVNKSIAKKLDVGFVGCASHRYNLAVCDILKDNDRIISLVREIMKKIRTGVNRAKLRRITHLSPIIDQETRWSSTYSMLLRYQQLKDHIKSLKVSAILSILPNKKDSLQIDELTTRLAQHDSITKDLQKDDTNISIARSLFDEAIEFCPEMAARLSERAQIVLQPEFESALIKILDNKCETMSDAERLSVESLKKRQSNPSQTDNDDDDDKLTLAQRARKRRKINEENTSSQYLDVRFIFPSSNIVERFFSKAGYVFDDHRKRLLPQHLEAQLFLHINDDWGLNEINEITKKDNDL